MSPGAAIDKGWLPQMPTPPSHIRYWVLLTWDEVVLKSKCFSFPTAFHIFSPAAWVTRGSLLNRVQLNWALNLSHGRNETQDPLPFFVFHVLIASEDSDALQFGSLSCFHVLSHELCLSDMFLVFPSGNAWSQFIPELVVTWAKWCLPVFSSVKLLIFPLKLIISLWGFTSVQFSSVTQSCPTLCNPMNRSTPGLPVHHQLPEFTQTHVHWVSDPIQPSHPLSSPSPPAPNPSQN